MGWGGVDTFWLHAKEGANIVVVGKGGREANQTDHYLRCLDLAQRSRYNRFQDWTTVVMKQMDFINHN